MPIDMSAAGKYQYLGGALNSMLAGRLTSDGSISVVDSAISKKDLSLLEGAADNKGSMFEKLGVDFVGSGFCYETADGMKLQMSFFSPRQGTEPITLTMTTEGEAAILSEIDTFAAEIKSKVFGFEQYNLSNAVSGDDGLAAFQTSHPEKAYKMGAYAGTVSGEEGDASVITMGIHTTISLSGTAVSMASGDLDGDGTLEHVLLSTTGLVVTKVKDDRLRVEGEYDFAAGYKANRTYVADMNGDGKSEIYVSGDQRFSASSMILSWNQTDGFAVSADNLSWYIRPLTFKNKKPLLIGQRSTKNLETGFLGRGIYELEQDSNTGRYAGWKRFGLPDGINIFDFALADLDGDGTQETVAVDGNEKLLVYSAAGELLSVSEQTYGGSLVHFGPTTAEIQSQTNILFGNISKEKAEGRSLIFIPEAILVKDIDGDGKDEIIVGKNQFEGYRVLVNSRSYSGGSIVCLKWDGDEFKEAWKTKKYPSYLSAYDIWLTGEKAASEDGKIVKNVRMIVTYAGKSSFLGISMADKTKVETFSFEIQQ